MHFLSSTCFSSFLSFEFPFDVEDDAAVKEEPLDHHSIRSPPLTQFESQRPLDPQTQVTLDPDLVPTSKSRLNRIFKSHPLLLSSIGMRTNLRAYLSNNCCRILPKLLELPLPMTQIQLHPGK
ncbi:histone-lysine N-methyltransferase [Corchorus capsularis]|uniref:Histone-lysine N-methyltransferase n=1 Tax=Corchorus capsularis TaxID=210143 RepID=A0A1R3GKJ8_COCAP|nr:histone-lysine N-methyltransferase [Corchorus capsularis]